MKSVFINEVSGSWILNILGNDIFAQLQKLGYPCRKGAFHEYKGEDIALHMWWRHAQPYKEAKINSVFVTHVDDSVKEHDLVAMKDQFDLFFCMSPEDATFLVELGFDKNKVYGLNLPCRNTYVRPVTMGIFSNCYANMKTKNEDWLLDYCANNDNSKFIDFCFIGHGWGSVVEKLAKCGCTFQWHCVDRALPHEYMYQQLKLSNLDYYLYMGMDGGAMGTYDAYAMGASLCVSDDGYHKNIPDLEYKFLTQEDFNNTLNSIAEKQVRKLRFFSKNTIENYVKSMAYIYENGRYPDELKEELPAIPYSVTEKRRSNYFSLSFERIRQPLVSAVIKYINRKNLKKSC